MRKIEYGKIVAAVRALCIEGTTVLPVDVLNALKSSYQRETSPIGKNFLAQCIENAEIAESGSEPICQDTGFAVFFVEYGDALQIDGGNITDAINEGVRQGYKDGYLRKSIVGEPLFSRKNTFDNTPAVIHYDIVKGDKLKIIFAPKGGGSENMSRVKMLKPSDGRAGVVNFVVDAVVASGGNPCPPTVVGVGIGGTFEKAAYLAKKALLRPLGEANAHPDYAELERELLQKINQSGVGPQGLGGGTTALAVNIEYYPCHIASLPVAVNLNCHAARHVEVEL